MLEATVGQIGSRWWVIEDAHRAEGLSLFWERWCDLTERSIHALKTHEAILREVHRRVGPGRPSS